MNFEKYTDRARGFVQSAQSLALREGHQQFGPEHLLKVLLDDPEGLAAGLIDRSGGRSREALAAVEASLAKLLKVSGAGAGKLYLAPATALLFAVFIYLNSIYKVVVRWRRQDQVERYSRLALKLQNHPIRMNL